MISDIALKTISHYTCRRDNKAKSSLPNTALLSVFVFACLRSVSATVHSQGKLESDSLGSTPRC